MFFLAELLSKTMTTLFIFMIGFFIGTQYEFYEDDDDEEDKDDLTKKENKK